MKIGFTPVRRDDRLELQRAGDVLILNGETFDFGPLPEGAILPAEAIDSDWFVGSVERIEGELHLTLLLPHGPHAPNATRFPAPLKVESDGPVVVPPWAEPAKEDDNAED